MLVVTRFVFRKGSLLSLKCSTTVWRGKKVEKAPDEIDYAGPIAPKVRRRHAAAPESVAVAVAVWPHRRGSMAVAVLWPWP